MRTIYLRYTFLIFLLSMGFMLSADNLSAQQPTKKQINQARKLANEGDKFFGKTTSRWRSTAIRKLLI